MSGSSYGDDADIEGTLTVNDDGADKNVRIESDNKAHMFFVDAGNDTVGIGTSTAPPKTLTIEFANDNATVATGHALAGGGSGDGLLIENTSTTTNAYANLDFRVATADGRIALVYDGTSNSGDFHFITDNAGNPGSRLIIKDNGSVGIGAEPSSPYLLDVAAATRATLTSTDTNVATRECARFTHLSTGTPAAGFGTFIGFGLENTNSEEIAAGGMACAWMNATDGAESSYLGWATNQMGSQLNQMTLDAYGLTVHAAAYGAVTGLSTQALTVRGNKYADYACLFENDGNATNRYGVKIKCGTDDNSGTNYAVTIADGDGTNQGYITFSGGTVSYGAFTGVHDAAVQSSDYTAGNDSYNYGTIVKIVSTSSPAQKKVAYVVGPTTSAEDKSAFGVYSGYAPTPDDPSGNSHQVFALGDGHILVCNEGGDVEIGDYICSSGTQGHGKKQSSAQLHNYTVAKATEAVTWENEDSNTKLISCTYHSA